MGPRSVCFPHSVQAAARPATSHAVPVPRRPPTLPTQRRCGAHFKQLRSPTRLPAVQEEAGRDAQRRAAPPPPPPPPPPPKRPELFQNRRGALVLGGIVLGAITAQGSRDFLDETILRGSAYGTKWYYQRGYLVVDAPDGMSYWVVETDRPGVLALKDRTGPSILYYPTALDKVDLHNASDLQMAFGNGVWTKSLYFLSRPLFGPPVLLAPEGGFTTDPDIYKEMQEAGAFRNVEAAEAARQINPE